MNARPLLAAAAIVLACAPASAEVVALKAGLLIDGTGGAPRKNHVIVVNGNPLDGIKTLTQPVFVMHEGTVVVAVEQRPR